MDKQKKLELKVGIVTILGIILFVVGMSLGKGFSFPTGEKVLKIKFPNSGGITEGSPVVVNGVKRGLVNSIKNIDGGVIVTATLDRYGDLKADASARITILEITGGKKIEIDPGSASEIFSLNNYIKGKTPPDIPELVALIGDISGDAIIMFRRLDTIATSVNQLLADGQLIADLKSTVHNASALSENANLLIENNYANINSSLKNLSTLSEDLKNAVQKHEPSIEKLIADLQIAIGNTKGLLERADTLMNNANTLVKNVDGIASDVKNKNGLVGKLIYDKEFANKLDSSLVELSNLVNIIKQHGINVNVRLGSRP